MSFSYEIMHMYLKENISVIYYDMLNDIYVRRTVVAKFTPVSLMTHTFGTGAYNKK